MRAGVDGVIPGLDCEAVAPVQPAALGDEVAVLPVVAMLPGAPPPPPPHPQDNATEAKSVRVPHRFMHAFYPPRTAGQTCARPALSAPRAARETALRGLAARGEPCNRARPRRTRH